MLADSSEQLDTGIGVLSPGHGETRIAYHAQHIVAIPIIYSHGLLVAAGQHHLRTAPHTQGGGMAVQGLGREALALQQYVVIEVGQDRAVEPDAVLDYQYHLYTGFADVMVYVHLILDELDDREDKVGIAQPAEYVVKDGQILVLHTLGDAVRERGEHHAVYGGKLDLDGACHGKGVVVGVAGHTYHEVYVGGLEHLLGLADGTHLRKGRRVTQAELHVLVIDFLLDAAVVLEHKGIVRVGHDEYIVDAAHHQVDKTHIFQVESVPLWGYLGFHDCIAYRYR